MSIECPFCNIINGSAQNRVVARNELAIVTRDGFPLTKGHTLIIPSRHVTSFFETSDEERQMLFQLVDCSKKALDNEFSPDSYNIGINDGKHAGQTVNHLHIHLIPRYKGDVPDARGGVRWVIPDKADYWSKSK